MTALRLLSTLVLTATLAARGAAFPLSEADVRAALESRDATLVMIDSASGVASVVGPDLATTPLPPCSTFKIWNTLIGTECGVAPAPHAPFYTWDKVAREYPDWNRDLTLREAFQVSCVPAFQALARRIGPDRMRAWIDRIGYGDRDVSAGPDVFWLPAPGRRTVLITPREQAELIRRLIRRELPFSETSCAALREVMLVHRTPRGTLYGKTGTGRLDTEPRRLGWFVGWIERDGSRIAFAAAVRGDDITGKDVRARVERLLTRQGWLDPVRP